MLAARKAGLKHYWANFGAREDRYHLFVGTIGILGPENSTELVLSLRSTQIVAESTKAKLQVAGLLGDPLLHLLWQPDV